MSQELIYGLMLGSFGAVSGLDILDKSQSAGLYNSSLGRLLGSVLGLADVVLMIAAFFIFPLGTAVVVIVGGAFLTAFAAQIPPRSSRLFFIYSFTISGLLCAAYLVGSM